MLHPATAARPKVPTLVSQPGTEIDQKSLMRSKVPRTYDFEAIGQLTQ